VNAPFHFFHFTAPPLSPLRRTRPSASESSFCPQNSGKAHLLKLWNAISASPVTADVFPFPQASYLAFGRPSRLTLCRSPIRRLSRRINWSNWKRNRPIRNGTWSIGVGNNGSTDRTCQASAYHVAHQTSDIGLELDFGIIQGKTFVLV
jgi:hypothetical protein